MMLVNLIWLPKYDQTYCLADSVSQKKKKKNIDLSSLVVPT